MFTADMISFRVQQKELHRQAALYRLAKGVTKPNPVAARIAARTGRMLIQTGEQLISRSQSQIQK